MGANGDGTSGFKEPGAARLHIICGRQWRGELWLSHRYNKLVSPVTLTITPRWCHSVSSHIRR